MIQDAKQLSGAVQVAECDPTVFYSGLAATYIGYSRVGRRSRFEKEEEVLATPATSLHYHKPDAHRRNSRPKNLPPVSGLPPSTTLPKQPEPQNVSRQSRVEVGGARGRFAHLNRQPPPKQATPQPAEPQPSRGL